MGRIVRLPDCSFVRLLRRAAAFTLIAGTWMSSVAFGALPDRPEEMSFPTRTTVTEEGEYAVSGVGNEIVLSGNISGDVTLTADETCRVTLDNVTLNGQLAIKGEAILWATGTSTLANAKKAVVTATGALMLAGDGTVTLTGGGAKKAKAVIYSEDDKIMVEGGTWNVNMTYTEGKGFGIAATKKFVLEAGSVNVVSSCTANKDTAVYSDKKDVEISGGILRVTQYGPKSVAINTDDGDASVELTGGAVILNVGGEGAKGIKCDGAFKMSGGILNATVSGGPLYEAYEYGDGTNLVVATAKTALVSSGTYLIEDVTASAAVKCGTVKVTGGTVRIVADGVCSRGLVADTDLILSGGVFDIQANGATSEPVVDLVTDDVLTQVELDRKTAACIKQGDTNGTAQITGGTFYLVATNYGGKCFSIDGALTVGTSDAATRPSDTSFAPDIQCSTFGQKLYVAAQKIASYATLGTATPVTSLAGVRQMSTNSSWVVSGSGENVDYTNPKCIKCEGDITFESGRLRMYSKCDGGEGLESKADLTINGGIIEGTCYDDVIQATDTITVNGGYLYCGSTGNDAIDANDTIIINGGVVLAFTLTTPEVGIDVDSSANLKINGGVVLAVGSATDMQYGSSGSQSSCLMTSASLSTYSGMYLNIAGTSYYVKVPAASSTSGSCSLMCSAPDCTTSAPTASSSAPTSGTAIGFHGVYLASSLLCAAGPGGPGDPGGGGQQPGSGGNQPDQPGGGGGGSFTYDTFLTDSTASGGCIVYDGLMTGYVEGTAAIVLPATVTRIADGALAGNASATSIDATAATGLGELPDSFAAGSGGLVTVTLPANITDVGASAFTMDAALSTFAGGGVTTIGDYAFFGCTSLVLSASVAYETTGEAALAGVSYETEDGAVYVSEAAPLVTWISAGGSVVSSLATKPSSYNTATLKDWLTNDVANLEAYLYADEIATNANFTALSVIGTNFLFTAQDLATLSVAHAALQVSSDLQDWKTVSESDIVDGVYTMPSATNGFARVIYSLMW